jgi:neopullulanase
MFSLRKKISLLLVVFGVFLTISAQPKVEKIEPPNWWSNHSLNTVRVLVRGENFQNAKIFSKNKTLKVSNIRVNKNATYLFFDVTIPNNTKPTKYEFEVVTEKGKSLIPFEILPMPKSPNNITNEDIIYLIMTDRFDNGDTSNDKNIDKTNPRMWHGGDFRGIINRLDYLKELGITAIWLTPWYDNSDEIITCDKPWCPMSSYHGYGAIDYYGVENHFGNLDDLKELINKANAKGIKVVQDQVANHVSYRHVWLKNPPLENWITPFQQNTFNNSVLLSPNGSPTERNNLINGWFDFSLPDMNYDEPEVVKYEIQNALWWIGITGINGIRQDTIQYMPRPFIKQWSEAILKQYPNYYLVGEIKKEDSAHTAFFQGGKAGWDGVDTKLPSVFDFKLWETSNEVFSGKKPMRALREVLNYDGLYPNINLVTTLTGNHDTDRFMSWRGATKEGAKLHLAFTLATRGIPHLYYGDEVLMTGGHDPDNRKDFTKFDKQSRTADEQEMFEWTQKWIKLRKENLALQKGKTIDLFYDDDVYVFVRDSVCEPICKSSPIIIAINNSNEIKTLEISTDNFLPKDGEKSGNETIKTYLQPYWNKSMRIEKTLGKFKISLQPKSISVYEASFMEVGYTG